IRLQVTPKRLRAETIILPLIDNSIYTALAQVLGGTPQPLDRLPVPKRNLFSVNVRFNTEGAFRDLEQRAEQLVAMQQLRGESPWATQLLDVLAAPPQLAYPANVPWLTLGGHDLANANPTLRDWFAEQLNNWPDLKKYKIGEFLDKGLGNQLGLHVYDAAIMFDMNWAGLAGEMLGMRPGLTTEAPEVLMMGFVAGSFVAPAYLAVPVKDAKVVDNFLNMIDKELAPLVKYRHSPDF